MKKNLLVFGLALSLSLATEAKNTVQTVESVSSAVTLADDVDYVITSTTPFTATGSIDITNTDHAVVIFENIRPSAALSYLGFISINGEPAVQNSNCQVRMYASGAIVFPYASDIKPLTVYSEQNFGGESVNNFGLENSGGYMNTLTAEKLNNSIRSFKLKRGYMVTFANNPSGRGYNRCFIADKEDLEVAELPVAMDKRISSYRVFKWYDAEKKGLANDTREVSTSALNVSWCYAFSAGEDRGIDCECVPHHIYEGWPAISSLGSRTYSPHMKTNNEPGNSADDHPQTVDEVLANWEELMATGMRLCSPSSHDGSLSWLRNFMDSIDARGWRCDILDMHCYWPEWNLLNQLKGWYDDYKRPIWVSEFVWGASWNNNGIFNSDRTGSIANQQSNYNVMSRVLTQWNNTDYIERYAYWNSEADCSKIYFRDGSLSILGEFYSTMKSGIGYKKSLEFVPKVVMKAPNGFTANYTARTRKLDIAWNNPNMEFTDSALLEVRFNDDEWQTLSKYECSEKTAYTYSETFAEDYVPGRYTYRVRNFDIDGKIRSTQEVQISLLAAEGEPGFQYGTLTYADTEAFRTNFDSVTDSVPAVFLGLVSYNNTSAAPVNMVYRVYDNYFEARVLPWSYGDYEQTLSKTETSDFMVISEGLHQFGDITMEVGESPSRVRNDSTWIAFTNPFPEGVTPVVIVSVVSRLATYSYSAKVWNITNEGFAVKLTRQEGADAASTSFTPQSIYYVAATPGQAKLSDGKTLTVGRNTNNFVDGNRVRVVKFVDEEGNAAQFFNPIVLAGAQTANYASTTLYRYSTYETNKEVTDNQGTPATTGFRVIRQKDETSSVTTNDFYTTNGDVMGWIVVSDNNEGSGIHAATQQASTLKAYALDGRIVVDGEDNFEVYGISGQQVPATARLARGIYIVKAGQQTAKVFVP